MSLAIPSFHQELVLSSKLQTRVNHSLQYIYDNFSKVNTPKEQLLLFLSAGQLFIQKIPIDIYPDYFLQENSQIINNILRLTQSAQPSFRYQLNHNWDILEQIELFLQIKFTDYSNTKLLDYLKQVSFTSLSEYYMGIFKTVGVVPRIDALVVSHSEQIQQALFESKIQGIQNISGTKLIDKTMNVFNLSDTNHLYMLIYDISLMVESQFGSIESIQSSQESQQTQDLLRQINQRTQNSMFHAVNMSASENSHQDILLRKPIAPYIGLNRELYRLLSSNPLLFFSFSSSLAEKVSKDLLTTFLNDILLHDHSSGVFCMIEQVNKRKLLKQPIMLSELKKYIDDIQHPGSLLSLPTIQASVIDYQCLFDVIGSLEHKEILQSTIEEIFELLIYYYQNFLNLKLNLIRQEYRQQLHEWFVCFHKEVLTCGKDSNQANLQKQQLAHLLQSTDFSQDESDNIYRIIEILSLSWLTHHIELEN